MASPHPSGRLVNPVPGGTVGRTDQGVDISGAPGTPVLAITRETLVGIIPNWFKGQPYYWFKDTASNTYNYVAEQFTSRLQIGQTVEAGQEIGQIASSGTGLELGWATASGQTEAMATTGYTEGVPTPAGQDYKQQVIQGGASGGGGQSTLAQLWITAGGDPKLANIMAAIAMAESSGRVGATNSNSNGSTDRGLWQINSVHSEFDANRLLTDPLYNAQAAVAIEKSSGLGAWVTYTTGAYKRFLGGKNQPTYTLTRPGGGAPGSGSSSDGISSPDGGQAVNDLFDKYRQLRDMPRTAPPGTKNPAKWFLASFTGNWDNLMGSGGAEGTTAGTGAPTGGTVTLPPSGGV